MKNYAHHLIDDCTGRNAAEYRMMILVNKLLALSILLFICAYPAAAIAQSSGTYETVVDRSRPKLDAGGVRLGAFRVLPAIGTGLLYDDNIFADNNFEVDDLIVMIEPELVAEADWSRAKLELGGDMTIGRYQDIDTEDYEDWRVWGDLDLDLGRGVLTGRARHQDLHEKRTSADDSRGIRPTLFTTDEFSLGYRSSFGRFELRGELGQRALSYDDTQTLGGSVSNRDRDRDQSHLRFRAGYGESQRFQPFAQIELVEVNYDQTFDNDGFQRSSSGFEIVGGTGIDLSGRTFGEVFVGYIRRDYDDPQFRRVDGPIFGGEVTWNVTGLTTLNFTASRLIKSTTIVGAAGIFDTGFGFKVDHELLRNLILSFDIAANNQNFEGIDRSDDVFRTGLKGVYMMNRYMQLRFGISLLSRDTSPADSGALEYDIQRIFVGIQGQI